MSLFTDTDNTNTDYKKFIDYTKLSTVTYFNQGNYGIGYKVKINDLSRSNYNVLSLRNTENTIKCGQLFVKISPIYDGDNKDLYDLITDILGMEATPSRDFLNEIQAQTDIYKKSNANLEAICPPIIYSNVVNNTESKSRAQNLLSVMINKMPKDDNKMFLEGMKRLYEGNSELKLGIIVMSFAENYDTLLNVLHRTNNRAQQIMYKYLAVYELLRLYDLGYMHGDYHLENILINTNYKYSNLDDMYLGRCLIIDYGMAFKNKHLPNSESTTSIDKLRKIAEEKQPDTNENAYSWLAYKWILDFIDSESDINSGVEMLEENINSFQQEMIQKINENYPGIIERIHNINATLYRGSVLRGGGAIIDNPYSKLNILDNIPNIKANAKEPIKLQTDEIRKTLSNEEFIQIFNPQNMNINEVVNKYENTLREGIAILNTDTKLGGKPTKKKRTKKRTKNIKGKTNKKKRTKNIKKKTTTKKRGGNSYESGSWVPFENIKQHELCTICQDPLQNSEQIADKGIIYQLSCGHQFHNNCLSGWCDNRIKNVNLSNINEEIHRPATLFKCPVCNQTTLHEEYDCTSMEAYRDGFLADREKYTTEKYTGIKPESKPESKPRRLFNFFKKGGKTTEKKRTKNIKRKSTTTKKRQERQILSLKNLIQKYNDEVMAVLEHYTSSYNTKDFSHYGGR